MSTDSEESLLEDALRADLPPPGAQARMQKRLLAAGVAVGNGMAVTSAAAAGGAPSVVSGVVGKALAMSWGVKLGALAVVAIPTVGLLVDSRPSAPALSAPAPVSRKVAEPAAGAMARPPSAAARPNEEERAAADAPRQPEEATPPTLRSSTRSPAPTQTDLPLPRGAATQPAQPSQDAFGPLDEARAHQPSTLAEETRILDAAFAELAAGRAARAGDLIAEHERRFPAGLLSQERQRAKQRLAEISRGE